MDFLFDCLAIGDLADAESHPTVDAILNLSQFHYYTPLYYKRVYFPDFEYLADLSVIGECTQFIREHILRRRRVLVHCFAGVSRSATICTAYLYECGMSFDEALAFIQAKHPMAQPMRISGVHYMTGINTAENILVIQLRQVGDVLLTTPTLKVLRDHYPHSRISYLTETGPAVLLRGNPHLDAIVTRNRKNTLLEEARLVWELRQARYDLVIDFFCNPRSAWMSFLTGAPRRIAAYHRGRTWWYTATPRIASGKGYAAEDKLALLRAVGIAGELVPPVLVVSQKAKQYIEEFLTKACLGEQCERPVITIDPTSRRQAKRWIPERYVQLADRLVERYQAKVIFMWGPGEREMVAALVQQGKYPHTLACETDLMQLAALIEKSDLHIGNCSAPRHIAVAVGTPSLTIMGPTVPENWTYPSPLHRAIQGQVPCLECHKTDCKAHDCMKALTVQEVEKAVEQLLRIEY